MPASGPATGYRVSTPSAPASSPPCCRPGAHQPQPRPQRDGQGEGAGGHALGVSGGQRCWRCLGCAPQRVILARHLSPLSLSFCCAGSCPAAWSSLCCAGWVGWHGAAAGAGQRCCLLGESGQRYPPPTSLLLMIMCLAPPPPPPPPPCRPGRSTPSTCRPCPTSWSSASARLLHRGTRA